MRVNISKENTKLTDMPSNIDKPKVALLVAHGTAMRAYSETLSEAGCLVYIPPFSKLSTEPGSGKTWEYNTFGSIPLLDNFQFQHQDANTVLYSLGNLNEVYEHLIENFDYIILYHAINPALRSLLAQTHKRKKYRVKKILFLCWGDISDDLLYSYRTAGIHMKHSIHRESEFPELTPEQILTGKQWNFLPPIKNVIDSPLCRIVSCHKYVKDYLGQDFDSDSLTIPTSKELESSRGLWAKNQDSESQNKICIVQSRLYQRPHSVFWVNTLSTVFPELKFNIIGTDNIEWISKTLPERDNISYMEMATESEVLEEMSKCRVLLSIPDRYYSDELYTEINQDFDKISEFDEPSEEMLELCKQTTIKCMEGFASNVSKTMLQYSPINASAIGIPILHYQGAATNTHFLKEKSSSNLLCYETFTDLCEKIKSVFELSTEELKKESEHQSKIYEPYIQSNLVESYKKYFS